MLPIQKLTSDIAVEEAIHLSSFALTADWGGKPLATPVSFVLALSNNNIYFAAMRKIAPYYLQKSEGKNFIEGLWDGDVAEFFLKDDASDAYQEFNLSPNGKWWTKRFNSYRVRDEHAVVDQSGVETFHEIGAADWRSAIKIPRRNILVSFSGGTSSRANVCGIFGDSPRTYISFARSNKGTPDFHRPELFVPLDEPR